MKKLSLVLLTFLCVFGLVSCGSKEKEEPTTDPKPETCEVVFLDGETELKKVTVNKGEKVALFTPTKEGYEFNGWYRTPNFSHKFDFNEPINKDTKVFGLFAKAAQTEDTRVYYVLGSGTSPLLSESDWGHNLKDNMKMTKTEGKNEYKITLDLYKDDQFQFAINDKWHNQRGYGYLDTNKLEDGTEAFMSQGTIGDNSSLRINIKVVVPGNYTFTLTTHPDDDEYEVKHPQYTEENKEAFNINHADKLTWVRNGDVTETEVKTIKEFFIKGSGITGWKNMYCPQTKFMEKDGKATLEVYLKAKEEFLIISRFTTGDKAPTEGNIYVKAESLDEASKALFDSQVNGNIITKEAGTYTLTLDLESLKLSATVDKDKAPAKADYYLDGSFDESKEKPWDGYIFTEQYKLTEEKPGIFSIKNVKMKEGSEFIIQAFKEGSTERGKWGTDSYNGLGSYNSTYVVSSPKDCFTNVSKDNLNNKVLVGGSYDISFDEYSKAVTITKHLESKDTLDIYVKGDEINGWNHGFKEDYLMKISADELTYELTITVKEKSSFGLEVHPKGEKEGYGTFVNTSKMGTLGDSNSLFGSEGNFSCTTPNTYKVVYTIASGTVDFYVVK